MRKVYISGPMTGLPNFNYDAFRAASARLRAAGFTVEDPSENSPPACGTWEGWMRLSVIQIARCTHVATLPGWERSRGARVEVDLAHALGMPVAPLEDVLALRLVVMRGSPA